MGDGSKVVHMYELNSEKYRDLCSSVTGMSLLALWSIKKYLHFINFGYPSRTG